MKTQPWIDNPYRLISWLEMQRFSANVYITVGSALTKIGDTLEEMRGAQAQKKFREELKNLWEALSTEVASIGCNVSASAARRLAQDVSALGPEILNTRARELRHNIFDEMASHLFLWIPPERAKYFEGTEASFGYEVMYKFPTALPEIRSAGECIAFGCYTATGFHLMRTMEIGLKATAKSLGLTFDRQDTWDNILGKLSKEEIKKDKDANTTFMANKEFYQGVRQTISAVKDATRNPTMHFEGQWDERKAAEILTMVRSFMRGLAEKIDENGVFGEVPSQRYETGL